MIHIMYYYAIVYEIEIQPLFIQCSTAFNYVVPRFKFVDIDKYIEKQRTDFDTDFYGSDEFDPDELDDESFGNMSFDENGNELY